MDESVSFTSGGGLPPLLTQLRVAVSPAVVWSVEGVTTGASGGTYTVSWADLDLWSVNNYVFLYVNNYGENTWCVLN